MKIIVNGQDHEHRGHATLADLLQELGADPRRIAVLVDDAVISAERRADVRLREGSRVEILIMAGGG